MRFSARILFSFFLFAIISLCVATKTSAQTTPATNSAGTNNSYTASNTNPDVPKNLHTWTQNVMIETMAAVVCQLAGVDPINPSGKCLGIDQKTGKIGFVENGGGAIGVMGGMISMLYTPPIHTSDYIKDLAGNFGIVKSAKAQSNNPRCDQATRGFGFCAISPLLPIWSAFRNTVYLLFVVVFIVIGFAIMLRIKIDPRTVMTIQNQIPKIIVGLLLVTFSFAIAGFLIDVMYLSIYLIGTTLALADPKIAPLISQLATSNQPFEAANHVGGAGGGVGGILDIAFWSSFDVGKLVSTLLSHLIGGILGKIFGGILGIIGFLIILIAIIFALFRLWFALISAYIFVLLDIVMAPFWIFAGLIPGSPVGAGLWLRDILSNLSPFPVVITMFVMAKVFMDLFQSASGKGTFSPPLVGGLNSDVFANLIGLGFILLTPNVVNMTKAALKAPKFDTTPIKQAIGAGAGTVAGTGRNVWSVTEGRELRPNEAGQWKQISRSRAVFSRLFK